MSGPIATRPELRAFVEAARAQPSVLCAVDFESVSRGVEASRQRAQRKRTIVISGLVGLAAAVAAVAVLWPVLSAREDSRRMEEVDTLVVSDVEVPAETSPVGFDQPVAIVPDAQPEARPILASAIRLDSTESVEVRGPWSIAVGEGHHEIELEPVGDRRLSIELPDARRLEFVSGRLTIEVVDSSPVVHLHSGIAAWVREGVRTEITLDRIELQPEAHAPSAAYLARRADRKLAAGDLDAAVALWRQLVRHHPNSNLARAAVLDLATQMVAMKRKNEARCAYRLYLETWPGTSVEKEVARQLRRLRKGPACDGLDPG